MKLEGRTAIVTGGGSGIGRAIALALADGGVNVALAARTRSRLEEVAKEISEKGRRALVIPTDVTRPDDVKNMVRETLNEFGVIDILVNNAGVFVYKPSIELSEEEWDVTIATNLKGIFLCCKEVLPHMMERKRGKIINISSIHGKMGDKNVSAHCASKFGVIGLTQALAREAKPYNININALCPGAVDTRTPESELLQRQSHLSGKLAPSDVARLVVFLASDDCDAITGTALDIFGGTFPGITVS